MQLLAPFIYFIAVHLYAVLFLEFYIPERIPLIILQTKLILLLFTILISDLGNEINVLSQCKLRSATKIVLNMEVWWFSVSKYLQHIARSRSEDALARRRIYKS